jgi:hypothetical protein
MLKTLAFLTCLVAAPVAAEDIPGTEFAFGLWRGGAQADAAGEFTHCYATLVFGGGDQLWVNVSKADQVEIIFSFLKETYAKDKTYEASIMMESGLPTPGTAFGLGGHLINFNLTPVHDAHVFLSQGSFLRLTGVGNDEAYEVRGIGGALGMVRACREAQRK